MKIDFWNKTPVSTEKMYTVDEAADLATELAIKSFGDSTITTSGELLRAIESSSYVSNVTDSQYDYRRNAREAYLENNVAYFCITTKARVVSQPRWELVGPDGISIESEADAMKCEVAPGVNLLGLYRLMQRPNKSQSWSELLKRYILLYDLAGEGFFHRLPDIDALRRGNGYLEVINPGYVYVDKVAERYLITPDYITSDHVPHDWQLSIVYDNNNLAGSLHDNPSDREILHKHDFHPYGDRGAAPLTAAWSSIVTYNAAQRWNAQLLRNHAKLSLVAILKTAPGAKGIVGGTVSAKQVDDVASQLKEKFGGSRSAGSVAAITGDWDIKEFGLSPTDMDWIKSNEQNSRNIARAMGMPPHILGLPGDSTYSNMAQAYSGFYKLTVLPQLNGIKEDLEHWLHEVWPGDWEFKINQDDIPALEEDRALLWKQQTQASDILTKDERRALLGYPPLTPAQAKELEREINVGSRIVPAIPIPAGATTDDTIAVDTVDGSTPIPLTTDDDAVEQQPTQMS